MASRKFFIKDLVLYDARTGTPEVISFSSLWTNNYVSEQENLFLPLADDIGEPWIYDS